MKKKNTRRKEKMRVNEETCMKKKRKTGSTRTKTLCYGQPSNLGVKGRREGNKRPITYVQGIEKGQDMVQANYESEKSLW